MYNLAKFGNYQLSTLDSWLLALDENGNRYYLRFKKYDYS